MSIEKKPVWKNVGAGYLTTSVKMVKISLHLPQIPESERPVRVYFWISDIKALIEGKRESMPVKLFVGEPKK